MADEKKLGFEIKVIGNLSETEVQIGRLTIALKQVAEAKRVIDKALKDGRMTEEQAAIATAKLTQEQKNLNKELIDLGGKSKGLIDTLKGFGTQLLALGGIALGFKEAMKVGKDIIDSTHGSMNSFKAVMGGASEATKVFFQMIANGEGGMGGFMETLKRAAKAGKDYAEALEFIEERRLGLSLEQSKVNFEQTELLRQSRDNELSAVERQKALNEYKITAKRLGAEELAISEKAILDKEKELKDIGIEAQDLKTLYENYNKDIKLITVTQEKLNTLKKLSKELTKAEFAEAGPFKEGNLDKAKKAFDGFYFSMTEGEKKYVSLLLNNDKVKKTDLDAYIGLLIEEGGVKDKIAEIDKQTQRVQNSINTAGKKEETEKNRELQKSIELKALMEKWTQEYFDKEKIRNKHDLDEKALMEKYTQEYFDKEKARQYESLKDKELMEKWTNEYFDKEKIRNAKKAESVKDLRNLQLQMAYDAGSGIFNINKTKHDQELSILDKQKTAALANTNLTESGKAAIEAEYEKKANVIKTRQAKADKLQALFSIAINTAMGVVNAAAKVITIPLIPWIYAQGLLQAALVGATPIPKFARGGKINGGVPVSTGTVDDTLIAVNKTETVLTSRHVAMLGGSGVMRQIGVPGYANGGYTGQQAPVMPAVGPDFNSMVDAIRQLQIRLDLNKVYSGLQELNVINTTQKI